MRIQDRQLANVEMMPGGFDQLRRLHETVDAAGAPSQREPAPASAVAQPPTFAVDEAADAANPFIALLRPPEGAAPGPSARPAPNPWASRPAAPAAPGGGAANPFASLFGGGAGGGVAPPAMPPFGGGALGAMGAVPGPEQLAQVDGLIAALETNPVSATQCIHVQSARRPLQLIDAVDITATTCCSFASSLPCLDAGSPTVHHLTRSHLPCLVLTQGLRQSIASLVCIFLALS
jgi:hypothetical protein